MNENQIIEFTNEQFGKIRTTLINGEPWFVAKDVALALGYSNPRKAVIDHVDDEDKGVTNRDTLGGNQNLNIINESGLYSLILSSKLPNAKVFKRWVTSEVIPSIRKTGGYATPEAIYKTLIEPKNLIIVLETLAEEQAKNKKLTAENAVLSVKAKYYDAILASSEALPITQIAKDYGMSAVTMNRLLSEMEIQYKRCGTWILYQDYADKGYTMTKTFIINETKSKSYTCWTQKGRLFLYNLLKAHGILPMCERPEISGYISR
ncbi:MAG: phage antirepressor [Ruminiclostridium sp.]|nr:phage antirepressor [Ruminiclostridium sp.]